MVDPQEGIGWIAVYMGEAGPRLCQSSIDMVRKFTHSLHLGDLSVRPLVPCIPVIVLSVSLLPIGEIFSAQYTSNRRSLLCSALSFSGSQPNRPVGRVKACGDQESMDWNPIRPWHVKL